jgi:hypothetical protein
MPATRYMVNSDPDESLRRLTRRRRVSEPAPQLPTPKVPEAAISLPSYTVAPPPNLAEQALARAVPADTPEAPAPAPVPAPEPQDPALAAVNAAQAELDRIKNAPVKKKNRLIAGLQVALSALGQVPPGKDWSDVAMQAGAALGGFGSGVAEPRLPGAIQKRYNVQVAEKNLADAQKGATVLSNVNYKSDSLALRKDKLEADQAYREWQKQDKSRLTDNTLNRTKFLQEYMKTKQMDAAAQNAFMNDLRTKTYNQRERQFSAQQHIREANLKIAERRAAAYEEAVKRGGAGESAKIAGDMAEAEALNDAADEYEDQIKTLDPDEDYDQIQRLQSAALTARRQAKVKSARSSAIKANRTPTPTRSKPKSDPLGLFR